MPLQATSGAASYDAFGGGVAAVPVFIEDTFSTFVYAGNSTNRSIVNDIDLSGKGGLVWIKDRNAGLNHTLFDTARGATNYLFSDSTNAQDTAGNTLTAFNSNGFNLGTNSSYVNGSGYNYVSWTFRKQPKFFDVVTYTGTGSNTTIAHSLGAVPACIMVKRTNTTGDWQVYHRSLANTEYLVLNSTAAKATGATRWNSTTPTSTVFSLGTDTTVNASGGTYVAYIFAHDAGGFGLTGTDNVISCGSVSATGGTLAEVNLGYEPQWLLIKGSNIINGWSIIDNMRGFTANSGVSWLQPNTSAAEVASPTTPSLYLTSTGFKVESNESPLNGTGTYIYIAIRRGPMKVPTSGTSVFSPIVATSGTGTTNFPVDMQILSDKGSTNAILNQQFVDRLRGASSTTTQQGVYLLSSSTAAESSTYPYSSKLWSNTGFGIPQNYEGASSLYLSFKRAPSFFDEVCYLGNGGINNVQNHSLADSIGMLIIKRRDSTGNWSVFVKESGGNYSYWNSSGTGTGQGLNGTGAATGTNYSGYNSYLTSTTFNAAQIAGSNDINANGGTYVAYLFATCAGVSKVGSYTGTGTTKQIDCGFTGGARFVLIKRTDSTGDWYVWDSARGIVSGNDSYLLLNSTAAEVTNTDYIDTYSAGFEISSTAPAAINASGGSFIFFAVA